MNAIHVSICIPIFHSFHASGIKKRGNIGFKNPCIHYLLEIPNLETIIFRFQPLNLGSVNPNFPIDLEMPEKIDRFQKGVQRLEGCLVY